MQGVGEILYFALFVVVCMIFAIQIGLLCMHIAESIRSCVTSIRGQRQAERIWEEHARRAYAERLTLGEYEESRRDRGMDIPWADGDALSTVESAKFAVSENPDGSLDLAREV